VLVEVKEALVQVSPSAFSLGPKQIREVTFNFSPVKTEPMNDEVKISFSKGTLRIPLEDYCSLLAWRNSDVDTSMEVLFSCSEDDFLNVAFAWSSDYLCYRSRFGIDKLERNISTFVAKTEGHREGT
jgi:hypothetical protein